MQFQSTLPRGERRCNSGAFAVSIIFQSTLPRGERPTPKDEIDKNTYISIHAPARGATILYYIFAAFSRHFNPRSREGSDTKHRSIHIVSMISIHAPARGATLSILVTSLLIFYISIHAPARGATTSLSVMPANSKISIHAPARGATFQHPF